MKVVIVRRVFELNLIATVIYFVLLALLISLGVWQLDRSVEKTQFLEKKRLSNDKEVIDLTSIIEMSDLRYRKVTVTGYFDSHHQYLIDNQVVNGQVGYYVMTPFKIDEMNHSVLINRGWVALNKDRNILPDISINNDNVSLLGRINNFPSVGLHLDGAEVPTEQWPSVVQVVDINVLSNKLGDLLLPFQIELDAEMPGGYLRAWKKIKIMSPEKHIAYAIQWFGLAITLTVLFIWFSKKVNE